MKKIIIAIVSVIVNANVLCAQSSFHAGYLHSTVQAKDQENSRCNSHGALAGWQYRVQAKKDMPLYLTLGADLFWMWSKTDDMVNAPAELEETGKTIEVNAVGREIYKTNYGGIKIPVNFAYEIALSKNTPIYIIPQIGVHAYVNIAAHQTFDAAYELYDQKTGERYCSVKEHDDYGLISSDDLGVYSYHRIVAGWQVGCSVRYGHYILGGTFEQELMHLTDYGHSSTFTIKLGYEL